jgi:glycosyltransferase involved in cell wall biosynthesis
MPTTHPFKTTETKLVGRVSVLIPTYNRAHLIRNAVDSVLAQTYSDLEIIVIDDGSADGTAAVMAEYLKPTNTFSDRIRFLQQENKGKSVALNNAFSKATGEWIAFLDSDDAWLPEKIEWQFRALQTYPECGACFTDCQFETDDNSAKVNFPFPEPAGSEVVLGKLPGSLRSLAESPCGSIITFLCRADLFRKIGGFDPLLRFTEDYDFIFRLAAETDFCYVNKPLAIADRWRASHERHTGSSHMWDRVEFRLQCEQYRFEKWLKMSKELPPEIRSVVLRRLRAVHSSWANWHLGREDYDKAREAIGAAAKYQMTLPLLAKWCLIHGFPGLMKDIAVRRGIFHDLA